MSIEPSDIIAGQDRSAFVRRASQESMKIRLIEPEPPGMHVYAKVLLPRLGLPIIAATLKAHGHDVLVYNAQMRPSTGTT